MFSLFCYFAILLFCYLHSYCSFTQAATFCVKNVTDLANSLYYAKTNNQDDVIKIVQGTYHGNFNYKTATTQSLSIEGGYTANCVSKVANNPTATILDGDLNDNVLSLDSNGLSVKFLVSNLTVQHAGFKKNASGGIGLYINNGKYPTFPGEVTLSFVYARNNLLGVSVASYKANLMQCAMYDNTSSMTSLLVAEGGGGVHVESNGVVQILNSTLTNNNVVAASGSPVDVHSSLGSSYPNSLIFNNNTVTYNKTGGYNEVVAIHSGLLTFNNNTITNNVSDAMVYISASAINLSWNKFLLNNGQGLLVIGVNQLILDHNFILNNFDTTTAKPSLFPKSLVYIENTFESSGDKLVIANNMIAKNNRAVKDYGAIYTYVGGSSTNLSLVNNTITQNSGLVTGGVYVSQYSNGSQANFYNNIIWGNTANKTNMPKSDIYIDNDADNDGLDSAVLIRNNNIGNL